MIATRMYKAHVPKVAKIVELLGGWEPLLQEWPATGGGYGISLDKGMIVRPDDEYEDHLDVAFPEDDDIDHSFKCLHIMIVGEEEEDWHVHVGLWGKCNDDVYAYRKWVFHVPKNKWQSGDWYVHGTEVTVPFVGQWFETVKDGEDKAKELAQLATEFDLNNIILSGCLQLVKKQSDLANQTTD